MKLISDDFSVYLPAVNSLYAETLIRPIPHNRQFPSSFTVEDLIFWNSISKLWHHPHFLHSVGQYKVGSTPDNAVTRRGNTDGILFGDSGGFQIGKGSLIGLVGLKPNMNADDACSIWRNSYAVRQWILGWLETNTNYAMTIDMPLWATSEIESPFHQCTHDQLTQLTVENLKFIDSHRQNKTKWLNVIQGNDMTAIKKWWDAVKWFPSSGYALSSSAGRISGLKAILAPLLMMRDENAFETGKDWLHMLGVSTAPWAIMFTAIQKGLRETVNPNLRISFDSSSPFQDAAIRESYNAIPSFGFDRKNWVFIRELVQQGRPHVGSAEPLPFKSPIADKLTLGDLNVRGGMYTPKQFDSLSHSFIANHNIWTYLETFRIANELVFISNRSEVPTLFKETVDMIAYILKTDNWASKLDKENKLLEQFKG
jgi:hypothetical protein